GAGDVGVGVLEGEQGEYDGCDAGGGDDGVALQAMGATEQLAQPSAETGLGLAPVDGYGATVAGPAVGEGWLEAGARSDLCACGRPAPLYLFVGAVDLLGALV